VPKNHPKWSQMIEGKIIYQFKSIAASMLLSRLGREYKNEPTPEKMNMSVDEAYSFFERYEMLYKEDLNKIFQ